ncbi:DUF523 domain-containing protein [Sporolactobacillus putidus]|uniref:DUF523 domain-containing protein n=1 Tax=Sporolactobacillus putidus TaxID=492735 RepID=A0A917S8P9_9BACL|nr:DUF523 domain-containing protein [Sporolactobacillus putidus]GGL61814.1 hypothetical protein GCM10007968_27270 [Sporolactobacillus putidus]
MIVVSSCLAGLAVRYNESHCLDTRIRQLIDEGKAISVCPELLGGFSTPREPAEMIGGDGMDVLDGTARVVTKSGEDVTEGYVKGAYLTLKKVKELHATAVVLKEYSPSCGSTWIYNGEFKGKKIKGNGVTAALLGRNGIKVISEERLAEGLNKLI